jgi:hypothetical protein
MTAGVGSLVVSAYRAKYGSRIPPYLLKTCVNELCEGHRL